MKVRNKIVLAVAVIFVFVFVSCSSDTPHIDVDPQLRVYNGSAASTYVNLGVETSPGSNVYDVIGSWMLVDNLETSAYQSFPAGTYTVLFDDNSDHTPFQGGLSTKLIEVNKKYIVTLLDGGTYLFETE